MPKNLPPPELLRKLLHYNPETGRIFFKKRSPDMFSKENSKRCQSWRAARWNSRHAGKEALSNNTSDGYLGGYILWEMLSAHRVAFCLYYGRWPNGQIDHENGIRTDNRIANLREVSQNQNSKNMKLNAKNKSGVSGVCWNKLEKKWKARINNGQKRIHLGTFVEKEEAIKARKQAEKLYGYHQNHGRMH